MSLLVFLCCLLLSTSAVPLRKEEVDLALEINEAEPDTTLANVAAGVLRGRLQIYSPDLDQLSCLVRSGPSDNYYLAVDKCTYDRNNFFEFDSVKGELSSIAKTGLWGFDRDGSNAVVKGIGGRAEGRTFFTLQQTTSSKWKWTVPTTSFDPILVSNDKGNTLCVEVSEIGGTQYAYVRVVKNGVSDQCTQVKLMLPEDDYVSGSIRYSDTLQKANTVPDCVTYDATAVPPRSALYLDACDATRTDQRFMYNMVTHHLRWATETAGALNGPMLFFWWSGPIKSYADFEEARSDYGWKISLSSAASVITMDDRGYTGYCWTVVQDGTGRRSITANQTCSSFVLHPEHESFFVKHLQTPPRVTTNVVLQVVNKDSNAKPQCVKVQRYAETVDAGDGTTSEDRSFNLVLADCAFDEYKLSHRFVITQKVGASCSDSGCLGLARWAGDYEHVLLVAKVPAQPPYPPRMGIISSGLDEDSVNYEFDFPLNREAPVRTTLPNGVPACWGLKPNEKYVVVVTDTTQCLTLRATIATYSGPDYDHPSVLTLARFDFTSMVLMPKTKLALSLNGQELADLRKQARSDLKARDKLFQNFDLFFADLGMSGRRRFRRIGTALQITPQGDLNANYNNARNGVQFGFLQSADKLLQNRYTLITVTLDVTKLVADKTYVLLSFARSSGCVVFVTGGSRIGMKCLSEGKELFTAQVQDWSDPSFTLLNSYHKISLLFSTQAGDPVRLYVDGVVALSVTNPVSWDILKSAVYIRLFTDFSLWQYDSLPASLNRFSLVVSNDLGKLDAVARRNVLSKRLVLGSLKADPSSIVPVTDLQTSWSRCKVIRNGTTGFSEGFACVLNAIQNGKPFTVPRDIFNLACSRPRCTIAFYSDAPLVGSSFKFYYYSNYPAAFHSENVGSPDLFQDASFVSDGWKQQSVSFGLKYDPDATSLLEVDDYQGVADVMRYRCKENCCASIGHQNIENSQGDAF